MPAPGPRLVPFRTLALLLCSPLTCCARANAQQPTPLTSTLARSEGIEPGSNIAFTRLFLTAQTEPAPAEFDIARPTLTVQCTKRPNGKLLFELFVNYGEVVDTAFYPPWRPANRDDLFPPPTEKISIIMEFLGYTKVKPVKAEFEFVTAPPRQLHYITPGFGSHNLQEMAYYFQFLRALPTLRLTYPGHTATFLTEPLLAQIRKEPLCRASGL